MKTLNEKAMRTLILLLCLLSVCIGNAQEKGLEKIIASAEVMENLLNIEETIPQELLARAEGVIIIPKLVNAGFVVGGKRGKGIALIEKEDGSFSNPVFVQLTGGSIGFQAGVQEVDLVLLVKNRETLLNLGNSDFTLGGDISIAAGPVGRSSSARTNDSFNAEVISYSKSKGIFAGISLDGSLLKVDKKLNKGFYGKRVNIALKLSEEKDVEHTDYGNIIAKWRQAKK